MDQAGIPKEGMGEENDAVINSENKNKIKRIKTIYIIYHYKFE